MELMYAAIGICAFILMLYHSKRVWDHYDLKEKPSKWIKD